MPVNERSLIGQEVAGYFIENIVGKGGMAVVYLALDPRLSRRVALKILNPVLSVDDRFRQRFILESRTVASIEHPNIIPIYEANADDDGVLYIAMRYVDGLDMRRLIHDRGPLPLGQANQIFAQVAAALDVAHAHDLIHRDVKPANILLAGDHVYLTDFGITKHRSSISGLTQTDHFIGTPRYMSPEQINKEHIDGRCDQYALGCVVYEALTGQLPFARENDIALLWAHLAEQPPLLSQLRPELPPRVDDVVMRALAKSPDQRYATCTEFVTALRDAISGPSHARSHAQPYELVGGQPPTPRPEQPYPVRPAPVPQDAQVERGAAAGRSKGTRRVPVTRPARHSAARRRPGRLPIVAATLVAAVAALALVAFIVVNHRGETWLRYRTSAAAPVSFEYPGDWVVRTHQDLFAVVSPQAPVFEELFVAGPGADWSQISAIVADDPDAASGVYVQVADTLDANGTSELMKAKMEALLPGRVDVGNPVPDQAGDSPATRFNGALHDPDTGTRLGFVSYVIEREPKTMLVLYFCARTNCDDATQTRIRQSVRVN
ncbi:serine/threonine protein kinase [Nonomuraea maritima]|uniref:non-specific serine/threonine protein kinase n=1 Tax=Nonomuraea maritima TaxID=683260 RepID=A0A1G8RYD7_9ACTN|nr:serine/threonine-protein kinase [Nonomuraea maritima]SDJ21976.1 serine/threonine protein kinase [Nonomuraea maritima]